MSARILLVEDDALEAARLQSALACLGHDCVLAGDGDAALRALEREAFDCVLLDLVLPGLDGMGVLRAMAAWGIAVPVVAAVTSAGLEGVESALKAGARDFVVKPAGALRLKVSIGNALAVGSQRGVPAAEPVGTLIPFPAAQEREDDRLNLSLLDRTGHARPLAHLEREAIVAAVSLYGGRMSEVARRLGIGRSTLYRRLGDLGLSFEEPLAGLSVAAE